MSNIAIYRLPYDDHCTVVYQDEGEPEQLSSLTDLNGRSGFVVAPFQISPSTPLLLIHPITTSYTRVCDLRQIELRFASYHPTFCVKTDSDLTQNATQFDKRRNPTDTERVNYDIDFANFHAQLANGSYRKLVLSRCQAIESETQSEPIALFQQACQRYPRLFIALVSTPQSGTWLTATPEILLDNPGGNEWRTIALAGTMRLEGDELKGEGEHLNWSVKNIQEQRYVATYIAECLEQFTHEFREEGPRTVRAAHLVHLRSDFTFTLFNNARVGDLLQALHPTPAVCGLPKREALDFIINNECTPRQYYSGFMGPLNLPAHAPHSSSVTTHLYVSLRCMQILAHEYRLYAGGGLLKDSVAEQEWQETEAKMQTMRNLIGC